MILFPHTMIRISGGAFDNLETIQLRESPRLADDIIKLKKERGVLKQHICEGLFALLPSLSDPRTQQLLLNLRRDIFNERCVSAEKIFPVEARLTPDLTRSLAEYRLLTEKINDAITRGKDVFAAETASARKNLKVLALDENLHKGLLLSSQSLYRRIDGYVRQDSRMKKKDSQVERGLSKYIFRMFGKTSPFSTFTNLILARHASGDGTEAGEPPVSFIRAIDGDHSHVVCHIRLNNYLFAYLKVLFTRNPNIYRLLPLRVNPTLQKNDDHYLYLTNSNNIESFQRIPDNPALEVFRVLVSQEKQGLAYQDLVRMIIENDYIDAPAEELEAFINQLLEYGFLEFDCGVSGIDPDWDRSLIRRLGRLGETSPLMAELFGVLGEVRRLAEEYGRSGCAERLRILDDAYDKFRGACWKIHEDAGLPAEERKSREELQALREVLPRIGEKAAKNVEEPGNPDNGNAPPDAAAIPEKSGEEDFGEDSPGEETPFKQFNHTAFNFTPEKMFYEDTSRAVAAVLDQRQMEEFTGCLHELLLQMRMFEFHSEERQKMLHYFIHRYGAPARTELLSFYEDYYRDFKKPEANRRREKDADNVPLPVIPALEKKTGLLKQWLAALAERIRPRAAGNASIVEVSLEDIRSVNRQVYGHCDAITTDNSYGCFVQFYYQREVGKEERLMGMLNASIGGYGKMLSRFLHIFDDGVTRDLLEWNRTLATGEEMYLENQDASFFNANLHPPLMPYEIQTPNSQNSLPLEQQVPVTELNVSVAPSGDQLQLTHTPTGRRVFVFDLGFQGYMGRSQLFNLLEKFTASEYLFPNYIHNAVNSIYTSAPPPKAEVVKPAIRFVPRIVYENRIILQRKTWTAPRGELPFREAGESDWAWFCRLNEWRRRLDMPDHVFVFVVDRASFQKPTDAKEKRVKKNDSPDDYKPQYISFLDPFSVNLLEKAFERVRDSLKIAEMLPAPNELLALGDQRYIMEFVIHWYSSLRGDGIFSPTPVPKEQQQ